MLFVLDNYDSFTYNLVQLVSELGAVPVSGARAPAVPQGPRVSCVERGPAEGWGDHGDEAPPPPDLRRAIPPGIDRYLAREAAAGEFPAHRARHGVVV